MNPRDLRDRRIAGQLSREQYWQSIQAVLLSSQEIIRVASDAGLRVEVIDDSLVVEFQSFTPSAFKMVLDPNDLRSAPVIALAEGAYEPLESAIVARLLECSRSFYDVGANAGYYTLLALAVESVRQVVSIEPNPAAFQALERNLALAGSPESVTALNIGLSSLPQARADLHIPRRTGSPGGSLRDLHPEEGEPEIVSIALRSFDSVIQTPEVDLLKVDVEGAELAVLAGAVSTLATHRPTIVIELLRKWMAAFETHPQDAVNALSDLGYQAFAISTLGVCPIDLINDATVETNFLFIHGQNDRHLDAIEVFLCKGGM